MDIDYDYYYSDYVIDRWNRWELRGLVLLSLLWQVLLLIFGSQRKYRRGSFISFLVWIIYLSANWFATVSLGTLATSQDATVSLGTLAGKHSDCKPRFLGPRDGALKALWAPFLLLHLGGPDTITAFSLEDNNLWLRHLLQLVVQVVVAFNIYLSSLSYSPLTLIAIPIFISGILKFLERTWVLRSASTQQFEDSMLSDSSSTQKLPSSALRDFKNDEELECVHKAYSLFSLLKRLYANMSLRLAEGQQSYSLTVKDIISMTLYDADLAESSYIYAFKLVELQLGFLYDVIYTKATVIYSVIGLISRFITFFFTLSALIAFHILKPKGRSHAFASDMSDSLGYFYYAFRSDIYVTYALFIGAICLEIYALISLIFSDWTTLWVTKERTPLRKMMYSAITYCSSILPHKKRWSESMAQHNLVSFCLKPRVRRFIGRDHLFRLYFTMELYWQRTWEDVDDNLRRFIFGQLLENHKKYKESGFNYNELKSLLAHQGDSVLKCHPHIGWSVDGGFDYSLLIWHVATDICFHSNPKEQQDPKCKASKKISDYMLYVLLMRPYMLPKWIDGVTYVRDTYREVATLLHRKQFPVKGIEDACNMMLQMHTQRRSLESLRMKKCSKSALLDACRLAEQLQHLCRPWEIICGVWIEKITYAASQCEWQAHAQQLRRGGELLTHICVLMVNLGLSEQLYAGRQETKVDSENVGWGWGKSKMSSYDFSSL